MKKIFLLIVILGFLGIAHAQTPVAKDSLYIVTYTTGTAWDASKGPGEQLHFKEHSSRLSQLRKDGVIKFGARYAEKGIIVISAANTTAAKDIVSKDAAVAGNLFNADVQKLSIFYEGCLEKIK